MAEPGQILLANLDEGKRDLGKSVASGDYRVQLADIVRTDDLNNSGAVSDDEITH